MTATTPTQGHDIDARPAAKTKRVRCGYCLTGNHQGCAVAVRCGEKKVDKMIWRCACACETAQSTKCVDCNRRGVEVTSYSTCIDPEDCRSYLQTKRRENMRDLTGSAEYDPDNPTQPRPTRLPRKATTSGGKCTCCGEPTRGGKFLPGHDARWVSSKVAEYTETKDNRIPAEILAVSEALHAKFMKRVGL